MSATSIHREKRLTLRDRTDEVERIVGNEPAETWILWCETNDEADALAERFPDAVEVRGSQSADEKEEKLVAFSEGKIGKIITKPKLAGFGLNWQHCARQCFAGLSFSYEQYYQAVRRSYRFGQQRPVKIHVVMSDTEKGIWDRVNAKADRHGAMKEAMRLAMKRAHSSSRVLDDYRPTQNVKIPTWLRAA